MSEVRERRNPNIMTYEERQKAERGRWGEIIMEIKAQSGGKRQLEKKGLAERSIREAIRKLDNPFLRRANVSILQDNGLAVNIESGAFVGRFKPSGYKVKLNAGKVVMVADKGPAGEANVYLRSGWSEGEKLGRVFDELREAVREIEYVCREKLFERHPKKV